MKTEVSTITFSSRGQVVIPRQLRQQFGIAAGTRAIVEASGDAIVLRPITKEHIAAHFAKHQGHQLLRALAKEKQREKAR